MSAERWLLDRLAGRLLRTGTLRVRFPDGSMRTYTGRLPGPDAQVDLRDERVIRRLLSTGAIGLADGWIAGEFDSTDLASVIELGALTWSGTIAPGSPSSSTVPGAPPGDGSAGRAHREVRSGPPWSTTTSATRSSASGWTGR